MFVINTNQESSASQRVRILAYLQSGRELTSLSILAKFGAIDGRKRISELRSLGYPIKDKKGYNESTKKHFKIYYLENNGETDAV